MHLVIEFRLMVLSAPIFPIVHELSLLREQQLIPPLPLSIDLFLKAKRLALLNSIKRVDFVWRETFFVGRKGWMNY